MSEFKNKTVDDSELTTMKEQINTLTKKFEQKEKIQKQASSWRVLEDRMVDKQRHIMTNLLNINFLTMHDIFASFRNRTK